MLTSRPCLSRELAAAVDVAAVATEVLAMAVVVDMALAVAAVLSMAMEATKVCFLFDYCVLFSTFLASLYPPYPTSIQQQRKLPGSFFRSVTAGVGVGVAVALDAVATAVDVAIDAVATTVAAAMIVAVVAVIVAVTMAVVADVTKAEDIAFVV